MPLSDEFKFKSTQDGSPPSGRRKKGTFRNVPFTGMKPENIDLIDAECIEKGISRFEWVWVLNSIDTPEGRARFHELFEGIKDRSYAKIWDRMDQRIRAGDASDSLAPDQS